MGHMMHNAIQSALADSRITAVLGLCRSIVSLLHSSNNYRQLLLKAQKELKLPQHQLCNDVATRWGSKLKMLTRIKQQMPAINKIFMDDKKYRRLSINWQDANIIDAIINGLEGFQVRITLMSNNTPPYEAQQAPEFL